MADSNAALPAAWSVCCWLPCELTDKVSLLLLLLLLLLS
jgi:hypothetical protein